MNNNFARLTIAATLGGLIAILLSSLVAFGGITAMPEQLHVRIEVIQPDLAKGGGDEFPGQRRGGGTHADETPEIPNE
jgi:hypothetical protein